MYTYFDVFTYSRNEQNRNEFENHFRESLSEHNAIGCICSSRIDARAYTYLIHEYNTYIILD